MAEPLFEAREDTNERKKYICLRCGHTYATSKLGSQCSKRKCRSRAVVPLCEFERISLMALEKFTIHDIKSFNKVYGFLRNTRYLDRKQPVLNTVVKAFVNAYGIFWEERRKNLLSSVHYRTYSNPSSVHPRISNRNH